jgi:hypothetical protein
MGFTNGAHSGQIEHFLPGYIESYALDLHGQVTLDERIQFHKIDGTPVYKSVVEIKGNCLSYINYFFSCQRIFIVKYLLLGRYLCWWTISTREYHPPSSTSFSTDMIYHRYIYY